MDAKLGPATTALADQLLGRVVVAVGTDLVDIDRIRQTIERQPRFVERVFTETERTYCLARTDPAERFAARFAAKEAVLKALGVGLGGAGFHDIEVRKLATGAPQLAISGRAQELATAAGIVGWLITMSHSDGLAHVLVAGLGDGDPGTATEDSHG